MRVEIPKNIKGKDLYSFLIKNKKTLINEKMSMPIFADWSAKTTTEKTKGLTSFKGKDATELEPNTLKVKFIGNMAMYADSYVDVLSPTCWNKTVSENGVKGKKIIAHLKNHDHTTDAKVGTFIDLYSESFNLTDLGVKSDVLEGVGLVAESIVKKKYDSKTYALYEDNDINQHSIGLRYRKLQLAINDPEEEDEFKVWKNYFDKIINKEYVEEQGYFWYVSEIELYEISAVLFGANEITPTLVTQTKEITTEPSTNDTQTEPSNTDTLEKGIDFSLLINNLKNI